MPSRQSARTARAVVVLATLLIAPLASAVTHTWNGGNSFGPSAMNNGLNWSGGLPTSANTDLTLIFPAGPSNNTPNQNIANPIVVEDLQINDFYSFSGSPWQMKNLGSAPSISFNNAFVNWTTGIQFLNATTVNTEPNSNIGFNNALTGSTVTFNNTALGVANVGFGGSATNTIAGVVNSRVNLNLSKSDAFAGVFTLSGGTAGVGSPNAFTPGINLTVNSPTVPYGLSNFNYLNPAMRVTASQTINNLTLNTGQIDNQSGIFTIAGPITATGTSVLVAIGGGYNFNGNVGKSINVPGPSDTFTIDGTVATGSFNKIGAGTLVLTNSFVGGNSTFSAQNVISAGKVVSATEAALGTNTLNNATLELIGGTYTGAISGTGNVVINGFVSYASLNSYTGGTSLTPFSNLTTEAQYLHGSVANPAGSSIYFNGPTNQTLNAVISGGGDLQFQNAGVVTINSSQPTSGMVSAFFSAGGGFRVGANNALGTGALMISAPSNQTSFEAIGSVTLSNQLQPFTGITVVGGGNLNFSNTVAKSTNYAVIHNSTGNTTMAGKFSLGAPGSIVVNNGSLTLGDPAAVGGFLAQGQITVNANGVLVLKSLNFISLPDVTLNGGTLKTPNGYAIPLGAALQGYGVVDGRVASANGSSIIASNNLDLGDVTHPAGVNLDGELYTGTNIVTLYDSNQSVLGSLTHLGNGPGNNGTLVSMSGAVINFGRNVTGNGLFKSTNALAQAVIMNGDTNGTSAVDYIEYSGYVKGVGTFNNVAFSGTFSPGLSPALLTVGNVIFTSSNVLDIEIGGLSRGGQYDAIDVTGLLVLNGQLKVTLINSFNPALGDVFNLFDGSTTGTFSSFNLPGLAPGLAWSTANLYTLGELHIVAVPEPTALLGAVALGAVLRRRRR